MTKKHSSWIQAVTIAAYIYVSSEFILVCVADLNLKGIVNTNSCLIEHAFAQAAKKSLEGDHRVEKRDCTKFSPGLLL